MAAPRILKAVESAVDPTATADYRTPMYAPVGDVVERARDWSKEVLQCRTMSHNWQPFTAKLMAREGYYQIVQRCPRCETKRHMEMSLRGAVFASWYEYPEGYLTKGMGRIIGEAKDALRLETVSRAYSLQVVKAKRDNESPRSIHTRQGVRGQTEMMG